MARHHAARKAAEARTAQLLQYPAGTPLDLNDEPILVAGLLLIAVIGDQEKCYFVTSSGRLKWSAQTLAQCMGYDKGLAQRSVKSAFTYGGDYCGQTQQLLTPRLQALRQTTLDQLRKRDTTVHPNVPGWGNKPGPVKPVFRELLLKSYGERRAIKDILDRKQGYPRQLAATFSQLSTWSRDELESLSEYLM